MVTVRVDGLKELQENLAELSKATATNVKKRALMTAAQPIADKARALAPVKTGYLQRSIIITAKVKNTVGKAEYAAAMKAGLGKQAAGAALRAARSSNQGAGVTMVYVGSTSSLAHLQEFGTVHSVAHPFMRPAWDSEAPGALSSIRDDLAAEIDKAVKRMRSKAAKLAAKTGD